MTIGLPMTVFLSRLPARLLQATVSVAILGGLFVVARSGAQPSEKNAVHLSTDWSHRHLVFSKPANYSQAWQLQNEPRYFHQVARRHLSFVSPAPALPNREGVDAQDWTSRAARRRKKRKDWAVSLGPGAFMGTGQFPAKFTFDINATPSCTADYVAFTTSVSGALQIVGFDNLYSTQGAVGGFCNSNGPSVKWAYNTRIAGDTAGTTPTSPVLSFDGSKVAYVESRPAGGAILHILKWRPGAGVTVQGTIAAPAVPDKIMAAGQAWNTTNCPAANSCVVNIVIQGAQADTLSSPFYDYALDNLYVGDDNGVLHKFTGVFLGTPAEVTSGGWPLPVHSGAILTAPVYDFVSKNIFVTDNSGRVSFVKEVGSTIGTCAAGSPPCLGSVSQDLTGSIVDPPLLDASTQRLLVFDGTETTGNNGSVYQFDTQLSAASQVNVGIGGSVLPASGDYLHTGTFDDAYYTLGPAAGYLYTCGKDPLFNNRPAIYQLAFDAAGVLSQNTSRPPLVDLTSNFSLIGDACSPVTEINNAGSDRIFFSFAINANPPATGGAATGCQSGQGCVASILLTPAVEAAWPPAASTAGSPLPFVITGGAGSHAGVGGASGIVVDNVGLGAQQSSIYFTFRTNSTTAVRCNAVVGVGCAVKLTQSALQ